MAKNKFEYIGYIKSAKSAGTAIVHTLREAGILNEKYIWDVPNKNGFFMTRPQRSPEDLIHHRWWQKPPNRENVLMWGVVRNPYDRIVSAWLYSIQQKQIPPEVTLEDYCQWLYTMYTTTVCVSMVNKYPDFYRDKDADYLMSELWIHGNSWQSQAFFAPALKKLQDHCIEGKNDVWHRLVMGANYPYPCPIAPSDYFLMENLYLFPCFSGHGFKKVSQWDWKVLKFENLQDEMDELCKQLDWPAMNLSRRFNVTKAKNKHYRFYHSPETVKFVQIFYQYEINLGNYTF